MKTLTAGNLLVYGNGTTVPPSGESFEADGVEASVGLVATAGTLTATDGGAEVTPWFEDSFESGDMSRQQTREDTSWRWTTGIVTSAAAHSGSHSIEVPFGPPDHSSPHRYIRFSFGKPLYEVWAEYWILYPANYVHRNSSPNNNKFFQFNNNGSGDGRNMLTVESSRQSDGTSALRRFLSETQHPNGSNNWPTSTDGVSNFIGDGEQFAIQLGVWTKIGIYYRAGSDGVQNDGRAEVWVNDELFNGLDWPMWQPSGGGAPGGVVNGGYMLGSDNAGYDDTTLIRIDDFKIYDANPKWG